MLEPVQVRHLNPGLSHGAAHWVFWHAWVGCDNILKQPGNLWHSLRLSHAIRPTSKGSQRATIDLQIMQGHGLVVSRACSGWKEGQRTQLTPALRLPTERPAEVVWSEMLNEMTMPKKTGNISTYI